MLVSSPPVHVTVVFTMATMVRSRTKIVIHHVKGTLLKCVEASLKILYTTQV